jgi:hypothetical protein
VSAPAIVIRLELERSPVVVVDCLREDERLRLIDWIEAHPRYRAIVAAARALELEAREQAA